MGTHVPATRTGRRSPEESDGSPVRAADEFDCHRNTVMHRLRRTETVTGRQPTDPRARLLRQLALLGTQQRQLTERPAHGSAVGLPAYCR